jgi:hypothetical protein
MVPGGIYYLKVYFGNAGNAYDLRWDDLFVSRDDNYEENDTPANAFDLSSHEGTWLSSIDGLGIQADDDWYRIDVTPGDENLMVDLTFTHADGNIDLVVYDAAGNRIAESTSVTDNESLDIEVPTSGTHYLKVYGDNAGNTYDLRWDDLFVSRDDNYEENDLPPGFFLPQSTFLSSIDGTGKQFDLDFYEIELPSGAFRFIALLRDDINVDQNLGLALTQPSPPITPLLVSNTPTPNEFIDITISNPNFPGGNFSLAVFGDNTGDEYDLAYRTIPLASGLEQGYEEMDDSLFNQEKSGLNLDELKTVSFDSVLASGEIGDSFDEMITFDTDQKRDLLNILMGQGDSLTTRLPPAIVA